MVLLSIFYTNQIHGGLPADCSFIFCRSMRLLFHLAVKILSNLSWRFEHVGLTYICRLYLPSECQQTRTCYATNTIRKHLRRHKSSTKHKEVRPDWNDGANLITQTTRLVSHGRFYQWLRLPFLKKYSIMRKRFRLWIVLFWTKMSQRLPLYLLFIDNIHIVLEKRRLTPC